MVHAKIKYYDVSASTFSESYRVDCSSVQVGFNNKVLAKPSANGGSVVEVQKQSFENPIYVLQGVLMSEISGTLTYDKLLEYAKLDTTGDGDYLVLEVDYLDSSSGATLPDSAGVKNGIKGVIRSYNVNIGLDTIADTSFRAGRGSITFIESK